MVCAVAPSDCQTVNKKFPKIGLVFQKFKYHTFEPLCKIGYILLAVIEHNFNSEIICYLLLESLTK